MKKILLNLFVFVLFTSAVFSQSIKDSLTLNDAIKLTVQNHPLIKQKEDELRAVQFRVEQQKSFYYPNVEGYASYTRIAPIPAFTLGTETLNLAPDNNYNFGILVRQTLYDFGKRETQVGLAESFRQSVLDNEELVKSDLSNQAVRVFYGILFLQKSIAVKDTQAESLNEHLKIINAKIKNGTATDYDALSTKTKIVEIQNEKIELLNEKDKREIFLKELIGADRKKSVDLKGNFYVPFAAANSDSLLAVAFIQRQEMKMLVDAQNTAKIQKNLIGFNDRPVLSANFGYGFKNGYEPNIDVLRGNLFFGVTVGVPIFNGNITGNKENEIEANINATGKKIGQVKESITTELYQAESDLNSSLKKLKSAQEQIEYAEKSLERAKAQYENGAGTNLDVLDAETALTQARLLRVQSMYKAIISYYSLRRAVGDKIY